MLSMQYLDDGKDNGIIYMCYGWCILGMYTWICILGINTWVVYTWYVYVNMYTWYKYRNYVYLVCIREIWILGMNTWYLHTWSEYMKYEYMTWIREEMYTWYEYMKNVHMMRIHDECISDMITWDMNMKLMSLGPGDWNIHDMRIMWYMTDRKKGNEKTEYDHCAFIRPKGADNCLS